MTSQSSQEFESYIPVYDAIPENWEEAKPFLVENLKKITEGVNVRTIGYYLNEELLSGSQFIPSDSTPVDSPEQFRDIFRKVLKTGAITAGANSTTHGISFDSNFVLIKLWVAATNNSVPVASIITDDHVDMDATKVNFTSPQAYEKGYVFIEYLKEG